MYIHTYLPVGPKIKGSSMCVFSIHNTWRCQNHFSHGLSHKYIIMLTSMLYKYICSHQCCTNTYAHINAVQTHMLTSMLYKYICSHQCCTNTYAHINAVQIHMLTSMLYRPMSVPRTPPHNHKHTAIRIPVPPFPPLPLSRHKPSPVN